MKKIKAHVNRHCTYCKEVGARVKAIWRVSWRNEVACEEHKGKLPVNKFQDHYSEADYQTWMRL